MIIILFSNPDNMCLGEQLKDEFGGEFSVSENGECRGIVEGGNVNTLAKKILEWGQKRGWKLRIKQLISNGETFDTQDEDLEVELYGA